MGVTVSLSEFAKVIVGNAARSLDVSPVFDVYTGVEITVDEETAYFAGNETGRVLRVSNPWGTQAQANHILALLSGFRYQPFTASGAMLNPAAELGDGIEVYSTYSGIYKLRKSFGPVMLSDVEAPCDEEIDHEYPYETAIERSFRHETAERKAQISITQDSITQEVTRATGAEGTLRASIQTNADNISARVTSTGGSSSSFGWKLTSDSWTLTSKGTTVFKATSSGIEVKGKISATSGYIGSEANGFAITSSAIRNGMTSLTDTEHNGVYIGTNGIALGKGNFKVTSSGAVTAKNLTITGGSIKLGDSFSVTSGGNVTANNMTLKGKLYFAKKSGEGTNSLNVEDLYTGAWESFTNGATWSLGALAGITVKSDFENFLAGNVTATSIGTNGLSCQSLRIGGLLVGTTSIVTEKATYKNILYLGGYY